MKKIIYEINKKNYILFEFNSPSLSIGQDLADDAQELGGIVQRIDIKQGLFSKRIELSVLIPEENARKFSSKNNID